MKKTALLAAAAALMGATPALAAEGYVGGRYASGSADLFGLDADFDSWQGEAAFGENEGSLGGQLGFGAGKIDFDGGGNEGFLRFDGHVYWQGASGLKLGVVVGSATIEDTATEELVYGIEGAFNAGSNTTIWASATMADLELFGSDADGWNVDAGVDFFLNPNFRLGGNVGTGNVDFSGGADFDSFSAGANAELRLSTMPVSVFASWQMHEVDIPSPFDTDSNTFSVGVRLNFGNGDTLQDRSNAMPFRSPGSSASRFVDIGSR